MIFDLRRYAIVYALTALVGTIVFIGLGLAFGGDGTSGFLPVIPVMVASMVEGQKHAKSGAELPSNAKMWRAALIMSCLSAGLLLMWVGLRPRLIPPSLGPLMILVLIPIFALLYIPANRWFYQMGFKSERNRAP